MHCKTASSSCKQNRVFSVFQKQYSKKCGLVTQKEQTFSKDPQKNADANNAIEKKTNYSKVFCVVVGKPVCKYVSVNVCAGERWRDC